jgi:hypothetical protein
LVRGARSYDDVRRSALALAREVVDSKLVGMVEVLGTDRVRMELETAEIGEPYEIRCCARHDLVGAAPRRKADRDDLDPWRPRDGCAFLIKEAGVDPVRIADQHVRSAPCAAQRAFRDHDVVADEIELRVTAAREENLVRVRDRNLAINRDHELVLGFHRAHRASVVVDRAPGGFVPARFLSPFGGGAIVTTFARHQGPSSA